MFLLRSSSPILALIFSGHGVTNKKHGVARALRLIRDTGGALVADEVGLGKTFIAGEVMQVYREQRQRAMLICPAAQRDSTCNRIATASYTCPGRLLGRSASGHIVRMDAGDRPRQPPAEA